MTKFKERLRGRSEWNRGIDWIISRAGSDRAAHDWISHDLRLILRNQEIILVDGEIASARVVGSPVFLDYEKSLALNGNIRRHTRGFHAALREHTRHASYLHSRAQLHGISGASGA